MIREVRLSENEVTPQPIPNLDLESKPGQIQRLETPGTLQAPDSDLESAKAAPASSSRSVVESVSAIPNELYDRLGLSMPRWLLWILTVVMGVILSGLLVSTLALWTPLWSNLDKTDEEQGFAGKDEQKVPLPGELWGKISQYQLSRPMNILIMGIEPVNGSVDGSPESFAGKSDTMLLVRLNPSDKTIRVLSIPRDTMIAIPEKGLTKLSDANPQGGPVLAARVVSRTLNNAPIDRYIRISTSGLRQLVDQLGGVEVFVPKAMEYKDSSSQLSINLVSGWQTLNGEQAEEFARFRDDELGDLARVQRQQALVTALLQRLNSPTVMPKLPQLTRIMRKYFDTNLKIEEMMALVNFSVNVERDNFQLTTLPGTFSRFSKDPDSYWLNMTGQQNLLNNYVGVDVPGLKPDTRPVSNLKIAIQNASNQPQVAEKLIAYLKDKGFKNIYTMSDWPDSQRQTQIIVHRGIRQPGIDLQKVLGLGQIEVSSSGDFESDITIRVGKDWK